MATVTKRAMARAARSLVMVTRVVGDEVGNGQGSKSNGNGNKEGDGESNKSNGDGVKESFDYGGKRDDGGNKEGEGKGGKGKGNGDKVVRQGTVTAMKRAMATATRVAGDKESSDDGDAIATATKVANGKEEDDEDSKGDGNGDKVGNGN
jgi:hypothetical protein